MKPTYVLDTLGTTIPQRVATDLNDLFFELGLQLGYTPEELGLLYTKFKENPLHPDVLRDSGRGKKKILQDGLYQVQFFPEVRPTLEKIHSSSLGVTIFSKGSIDVITEIYRQGGLLELIGEENIVSSANFRMPNKRDPRSYLELAQRLAVKQRLILSYTSDDPLESIAFTKAFPKTPAYLIDRQGTITESAIPVVRSLEEVVR